MNHHMTASAGNEAITDTWNCPECGHVNEIRDSCLRCGRKREIHISPITVESEPLPRWRLLARAFFWSAFVVGSGAFAYFNTGLGRPGPDFWLLFNCMIVPGIAIIGGVYGFTIYFLYYTVRYRKPKRFLKVLLACIVLAGPLVGLAVGADIALGLPFYIYFMMVAALAFWFVLE